MQAEAGEGKERRFFGGAQLLNKGAALRCLKESLQARSWRLSDGREGSGTSKKAECCLGTCQSLSRTSDFSEAFEVPTERPIAFEAGMGRDRLRGPAHLRCPYVALLLPSAAGGAGAAVLHSAARRSEGHPDGDKASAHGMQLCPNL